MTHHVIVDKAIRSSNDFVCKNSLKLFKIALTNEYSVPQSMTMKIYRYLSIVQLLFYNIIGQTQQFLNLQQITYNDTYFEHILKNSLQSIFIHQPKYLLTMSIDQ